MTTPASRSEPGAPRQYRYYDLVMAAFVTVLLCANVIGAAKVARLGGFTFGAGVLFFPISYVFGDVLTEVYGYARARKVVWAGFGALAFASFMSSAVLAFPPAPGWPHQAAYETVFGGTPRIVLASLVAYFCGEFCNSYVLAKMKLVDLGASCCGAARSARRSSARRSTRRSSTRSRSWESWESELVRARDAHQLRAQGAAGRS